jgi:hypothetical protein
LLLSGYFSGTLDEDPCCGDDWVVWYVFGAGRVAAVLEGAMMVLRTMVACLFSLATVAQAEETPWIDLFENGLEGWTAQGGEWSISDGVVTGKAGKDENAWLIYRVREFADFEFSVEFRTLVPTNGGVQFRSHWLPKTPLKEGELADEVPKVMYGYQANVETRQRVASGRLVDENGRGPLAETPLAVAKKTLKQRDWNSMRVVARGGVIEVYLKDVLAHRTEDEAYLNGFIALQCFAFNQEEASNSLEYRNLRVKDYGRDGKWRSLFDGETLNGWKAWGEEEWSVENGAIIGRSGPKELYDYLATDEQWKDFRVRAAFKMLGEGNFGLFYHSTLKGHDKNGPKIAGVQGEVEPGYPSATGWLYESYQRGWLVEPPKNTVGSVALRRDDWNTIEIRSVNSHVTTWVNGVRALDLPDKDPRLFEGSFALQLHSGGADGIAWKDIYVIDAVSVDGK